MNDPVNYVDLFGLTSNDICYTVQPGDCVWKIADKYDCTTQQVIDNNNFSNPNLIHPGDKIYIPVATPATASDTGSTISVATPSNSVSSGNSSNGSGAGNASMGGGTGLSNIASSMYAAASMNNAASATVTAQASPEIHNTAAEPTLLEKAHNILDILGCFSDIPDGINALLYLYEGNQKEAALCAICFLPFGDAISKGRKVALNAIPEVVEFAGKHGDEAVELALKKGGKASRTYQSTGRMADNLLLNPRTNTNGAINLTEWRRSISKADIKTERLKFLGEDAVKVDGGIWRSLDGTRQFRVVESDYFGRHGIGSPLIPNTPHVHFEFLGMPNAGGNKLKVIKNVHVPLK